MRKWFGAKRLGLLTLVGVGLLFAGCNQQAQQPSGGGTTPPPSTPTVVAIEGVYRANTFTPVNPGNVAGPVIVRAKVVPGSSIPDKIQFLIDGKVRYEVSFGVGSQRVRAQGNSYTFEWALNTAAVKNFSPLFANGPHALQVRVVDKGGNTIAESQASNLVFNNADFMALKLSGNALNKGGNRYYGGGDVTIEVVPVIYSGKQVKSVTLTAWAGVDLDPATPGVQNTKTLTQAPFSFTIPYSVNKNTAPANAALSGLAITLTYGDTTQLNWPAGGTAVFDGSQVLVDTTGLFANNSPFSTNTIRVDDVAPSGATNAVVCRGNTALTAANFWVADANLLAGVNAVTETGVGGSKAVVDVKTTTGQTVISGQALTLAAGCTGQVGALQGLPEGGFYRVIVTALKDDLGNTRTFNAPLSSIAFGVDKTAPQISLASGRDNRFYINNLTAMTGMDLSGKAVGPNLSTAPAYAKVKDPASGTPAVASGIASYVWSVNGKVLAAPTTDAIPTLAQIQAKLGSAPQGYYDLSVKVKDNAGNASSALALSALYDATPPNVVFTQPTVTALTGGTSFTATAHATDNVDLKSGEIYWSDDTNKVRFEAYQSQPNPWKSGIKAEDYTATLTAWKPATGTPANFSLFARVRDQAGNAPATAQLSTLTVTPANTNTAATVAGVTETPAITQASGGSTTLTITLTPGTAQVKAVHVYLWSSAAGGYKYYSYTGDAGPQGGNKYAAVVTVPANLGTPEVLIVVEHDNGLVAGYIYDYQLDSATQIF